MGSLEEAVRTICGNGHFFNEAAAEGDSLRMKGVIRIVLSKWLKREVKLLILFYIEVKGRLECGLYVMGRKECLILAALPMKSGWGRN